MTKTKKISINTFDKIVAENYTPTENLQWHGVDLVIKKTLTLKEVMTFVNTVVKGCFTTDDASYIPEVKDFFIKCCIVDMYTNLSLPDNSEHKYNLIYCSDIIESVLPHINEQQFNEMCQAINDKLKNLAQANIEMVHKQMNELYTSFNALQEKLSSTFSNVNSDDVVKLIGAITGGKLDEDKLVKAYVSQTKSKKKASPKGGDK